MKSIKQVVLIVCFLWFVSGNVFAQNLDEADPLLELGNLFVPGLLQISNGQAEGYAYLWGSAAFITGACFQGPMTPDATLKNVFGNVLSSSGLSVLSYSFYAYYKDTGQLNYVLTRESFVDLLSSPYNLDNLSSIYVLPLIGITVFNIVDKLLIDDEFSGFSKIAAWYSKKSVPFWGITMNPWVGTSLYLFASCIQMTGVAISEEVLFRGFANDLVGPGWSSVFFGSVHLPNIFISKKITKRTVFNAVVQTLMASCIGLVLADRMEKNEGYLSEAVAFHFWWNMTASVFNLLHYIATGRDEPDVQEADASVTSFWVSPTLRGGVQAGFTVKL